MTATVLVPTTASGQANERFMGFRIGLVTSSTEPVDTPDFPDTEASTLSCSTRFPLSTDSGGEAGSAVVPSCPFDSNAGGLSLVAGGLVDVPLGSYILIFDVRYNHGLDRMETRGPSPDYRGFHSFAATVGFAVRSPWS